MDRVGLLVGGKHGRLSKLRLRFLFAVYLAVLSVSFPHIPLLEARGVGALLACFPGFLQ
jgi:hypothetical protein